MKACAGPNCKIDQDATLDRISKAYSDANDKTLAADYSMLSQCAYGKECQIPEGYTKVDPTEINIDPAFLNQPNGFKAVIYRKGDQMIVSFAGTDDIIIDTVHDLAQASGIFSSSQYDAAYELAQKLKAAGVENLSFTGHSLGGGLAAVAAASTGHPAKIYNAAPLSVSTLSRYNIFSTNKSQIDSYVMEGDPVTASSGITPTGSVGNQHIVKSPNSPMNVKGNHSIDAMINALNPPRPNPTPLDKVQTIPVCGTTHSPICRPKTLDEILRGS